MAERDLPGKGRLPDPFNDLASSALPQTVTDALRWSQAIAQVDPTFREAMERVASYFITDIEVRAPSSDDDDGLSKESKDKFEEFLRKSLLIGTALRRAAMDYLVYGVSFTSILPTIRRTLWCPNCPQKIYPLKTVYSNKKFNFKWDGASCEFRAKCPECGKIGAWKHDQEMGGPESTVTLKHWSAHQIEILHDEFSDHREFVWKIPDTFRKQIREGKLIHLENTPWEVIQAVKDNDNFKFAKGVIYYMYEPPLAGFDAAGWGISKALTNFRQAYHCQMLRRFNEAICQEFLVPFRVLSPEPRAGSDVASDSILGTNLMNFKAQMESLVKRHKRDPGVIQVSPVPVHYQMLGGEANQLAPFQLIDQATDMLLNGSGVPADMYKGTLSLQAAPVGLRLFEARWKALVDQLNQFLDGVVDRVAKLFSWEPVDAKLKRVQHADDLNRQMALLQLMMGGQISQTTGLGSVGAVFRTEQDQLLEEQAYVQKKQQQMAERAQGQAAYGQMAAMSGSSPFAAPAPAAPGGDPAAAGGGGGGGGGAPPSDPTQATPEEIQGQAQQIATQLSAQPEEQRRPVLTQLKKESPVLHAVVSEQLDAQRTQQKAASRRLPRYTPDSQQLAALIRARRSG
jgi:hypothetical protein